MKEYQSYGNYSQQDYEASGTSAGTIITSLLIGAGIGAVIALLFTPKSGSELRGAIGRGYRKTVSGVSQRTRELRARGSNLLGFGQRGATEVEKHYGQG